MPTSSYMFIDGNAFQQCIRNIHNKYFPEEPLPSINWRNIASSCSKVFYYDAIPVQKPNEDNNDYQNRIQPKIEELNAIDKVPCFHVRTGDAVHRKSRGHEQKMVDVQFAVNAMQMAQRGNFNECKIIAGDLDFKPLIEALVEMGIHVELMYPQEQTNIELISAADVATPINIFRYQMFLNLSSKITLQLPNPSFTSNLNKEYLSNDILNSWDNEIYGKCMIVKNGPGYKLIAEKGPNQPSNNLEITGHNLEVIKKFACDVYDIATP